MKKIILKVVLDSIFCLLAFLPWIVLNTASIQPFWRGFFCDDESLQLPYHSTTISSTLVYCLGLIINIIGILAVECYRKFYCHQNDSNCKLVFMLWNSNKKEIHPFFLQSYAFITVMLFGAAFEASVVETLKYSVGRLRPHFFDVCQPNWTEIHCTDENGLQRYVEDYTCLGKERIKEARLSFPSGHSSMAVYFSLYFVMYLQARIHFKFSKLFKAVIQIILLLAALIVCVSRIRDNKHHWGDVFSGALIGGVVAFVMVRCYSGFYNEPTSAFLFEQLNSLKNNYSTTTLSSDTFPAATFNTRKDVPFHTRSNSGHGGYQSLDQRTTRLDISETFE